MKAIKKRIVVDAVQVKEPRMVLTAHGRVRAEAFDYILTDPATGDTWPIKADLFHSTYDILEEEA